MNKIDLNDFIKNKKLTISNDKILKDINGGCTFEFKYCTSRGNWYISKVVKKCSNYALHRAMALMEMNG